MPNHYYGYEPEEPDISFSSSSKIMDTVYRRPLQDMSTNPSSPLYQAMNNQRGLTYTQMQNLESNEPEFYTQNLEGSLSETALGQAMHNQRNSMPQAQSMEGYLESLGIDNSL